VGSVVTILHIHPVDNTQWDLKLLFYTSIQWTTHSGFWSYYSTHSSSGQQTVGSEVTILHIHTVDNTQWVQKLLSYTFIQWTTHSGFWSY